MTFLRSITKFSRSFHRNTIEVLSQFQGVTPQFQSLIPLDQGFLKLNTFQQSEFTDLRSYLQCGLSYKMSQQKLTQPIKFWAVEMSQKKLTQPTKFYPLGLILISDILSNLHRKTDPNNKPWSPRPPILYLWNLHWAGASKNVIRAIPRQNERPHHLDRPTWELGQVGSKTGIITSNWKFSFSLTVIVSGQVRACWKAKSML